MPPPPNKKVGPSVVVETSTNETAPLLVSDGTLQMDGMADDQIGGRPKRPPPSALFYATTSWVLFLEGLSSLSGLAISYFFKNTLKCEPAMLSTVSSLTNLPWTCKPLYGFVSDAYPVFGYRRRPYIFLAGLLGSLSWVLMWWWVDGVWQGFWCMLIGSAAIAVANVMSQALVVQRSKGESQEFASHLQSVVWGAAFTGALIGSFLSGYLLKFMSDRSVFLLCAALPFTLVGLAFVIPDPKVVASKEGAEAERLKLQALMRDLYTTLMLPDIFYPTAFIFLLNATPSTGSAWFYFYSSKPPLGLGFTSEFLGTVNVVGSVCNLAAVVLFQAFLKKTAFRPLLIWGTVISTALGLSNLLLVFHTNRQWGIPDTFFCVGESAVQSVVGWVTSMPIIVLAARLCPEGMEGTMYALIMSINNLGGIVGSQFGALICALLGVSSTNLDNFWLLVFICNASNILPLFLIGWIPARDPELMLAEKQQKTSTAPAGVL
eukprot:CAMPEP_0181304330 /NCGR_PEP_ID=MMETSP1101-20121128/9093_1 /TAXON_ID=46948 /ORGANISM="Rhodomonas abbreviata, Strain Caron Lab Isolate" /LENGTH=489 /DNA_ID=CAMNT_0023410081 /DNA_START=119 /DNA_END=1588 /DNA_ORIENTATION=-